MQLGTKENDHDHSDGQEECNQEHKKMTMTMMMVRMNATKKT
jgi:hypothetical protein